ncbi:MAG: 1-deoxy-D-xylulose-5-phosphate reductoisomerase [Actinomycetota bacterium]
MADTVRRVVILGSTGSIGRQALDVVAAHPDRFEVAGLVAGSDHDALREQAASFPHAATGLGPDAAVAMARSPNADVILNAIVGAAGLRASIAALEEGKSLALANKESLVAGGELCLAAARRGRGRIVPVDSEHAAVAQCLSGIDRDEIARVVLTASGGPFRTRADLGSVTVEDALSHPTWTMGPKITVDSATLMNKGLEIIEAHFLFGLDYERLDVVVHPQSIVHGIVEFADGSMLMQAAPTDMRIPIQAALSFPDRIESSLPPPDLAAIGSLEFEPVDHGRFPCVRLARDAGVKGGSFPAALNAANEAAVEAFLAGRVKFLEIPAIMEEVLDQHEATDADDLDTVLDVDAWARARARDGIARRTGTSPVEEGR